MDVIPLVFWICVATVAYVYAGYPLAVAAASRLFGRDERPAPLADAQLPRLSILVAAHNEAAVIGTRIDNLLTLDYPADKLEIVVASDGSDDGTTAAVRQHSDARVKLLEFAPRRGKAAVLNDAFRQLTGEIVLLSDANTFMDPRAARTLARWFVDPAVGVVCGRLILTDPATGRNADSVYWRCENFLKRAESRLGALLGANGAIYAIRRSAFTGIRASTAVDDFVIPLLARIRSGCRLVYDEESLAFEETPAEISSEFRRRSRIGAGGFQSLAVLWPLLNPRRGWIAFTFWSHKILRWTCPFFLIGALASNLLLALSGEIYLAALCLQLVAYGIAILGNYLPGGRGFGRQLVRVTTLFASMNLALLVGFWMWAMGRQGGVWHRTAR